MPAGSLNIFDAIYSLALFVWGGIFSQFYELPFVVWITSSDDHIFQPQLLVVEFWEDLYDFQTSQRSSATSKLPGCSKYDLDLLHSRT
jgi:hypothetical protein